jgi:hypothetical protein
MTKDVQKIAEEPKKVEKVEMNPVQEPVSAAPALDPAMLAAIQAAVQSAVGTIVASLGIGNPQAQKAPQTAPNVPQVNNGMQPSYVSKLKGIPVEPGQDLRHVHPSVINDWFNVIETRWKENYNKKMVAGSPVNMNWTRG